MSAHKSTSRQALTTLLMKYGGEVNSPDDNGDTPLLCACRMGNVDVARELLAAGADATITNRQGKNSLDASLEARSVLGRSEVHVCAYTYMRTLVCVHVYAYTYVRTRICVHLCAYTHMTAFEEVLLFLGGSMYACACVCVGVRVGVGIGIGVRYRVTPAQI